MWARPKAAPRDRGLNEGVDEPQLVLDPFLTSAALFLTLTVEDGGEDTVRDLLADLDGLVRTVGFRVPENGLSCAAGVGSDAWDRLFGGPRPADLHPFVELEGPRHHAPSTPGDLLLHIRSEALGPCWELARLIMDRIGRVCRVEDEVHGFRYFDCRDLLGFVDGTENPTGAAMAPAALDDDGGTYVIVQKYLHAIEDWDSLSTEEQERVIGRTKLGNVELDDAVKPPNSHVALNVVTDPDGTERKILRANMAFGSVAAGETGTYFIGYAATPAVTEQMLRNMFLGDPAGNTDRILDFSTAVTGCLFYVPPAGFFDGAPAPGEAEVRLLGVGEPTAKAAPSGPDSVGAPADPPARADGSLGIGSLRPDRGRSCVFAGRAERATAPERPEPAEHADSAARGG